jgi:hypothetical protein
MFDHLAIDGMSEIRSRGGFGELPDVCEWPGGRGRFIDCADQRARAEFGPMMLRRSCSHRA